MPDQARPAEIEDVLSSIRRLVAGEGQREPLATSSADDTPPAAEREVEEDALILTPSLLVKEDASETADAHQEWAEDAAADSEPAREASVDADAMSAPLLDEPPAQDTDTAPPIADPDEELIADLVRGDAEDTSTPEDDTDRGETVITSDDGVEVTPDASVGAAPSDEDDGDVSALPAPSQSTDGNGDAPSDAPDIDAEPRKSPFLPETLVAQRIAETERAPASQDERRSGFGFAGARRDDPVRHVPISDLRPAASVQEEPSSADTKSVVSSGEDHDPAKPDGTAPAEEARTLHLSVATDPEGTPLPATDAPPAPSRGALISPGFAVQSAASDEAAADGPSFRRASGTQEASAAEEDGGAHLNVPDGPEIVAGDAREDIESDTQGLDAGEDEEVPPTSETIEDPRLDDVLEEDFSEPEVDTLADGTARAKDVADDGVEADLDPAAPDVELARSTEQDPPADGGAGDAIAEDAEEPDFLPDEEDAQSDDALKTPQSPELVPSEQQAAQPDVTSSGAEAEAQDDLAPGINVFGGAASSMDEAALRALIRDVVHEELQGALGERVSQNIRLLIRREVSRAIEDASKDS